MDVEDLISKRNSLESRKAKLLAKLDLAKTTLSEIDRKLEEKGIDPSKLEEEISSLRARKEVALKEFASALQKADEIISTTETKLGEI